MEGRKKENALEEDGPGPGLADGVTGEVGAGGDRRARVLSWHCRAARRKLGFIVLRGISQSMPQTFR